MRAGFILAPQSWIMAEWAFKNGSKRVVTLVNDWAPGVEAETAFKTRFVQVGGEIIGVDPYSARQSRLRAVPAAYQPISNRILPLSISRAHKRPIFTKQFAERGLGQFRDKDHRAGRFVQ